MASPGIASGKQERPDTGSPPCAEGCPPDKTSPGEETDPESGAVKNQPGAIRLTFPSNPMSVRNGLKAVLTSLQPYDMDAEELGTIELVLAEALNNIGEHAYEGEDRGLIHLECLWSPGGLHVQIQDQGREMPDGHAPIGTRVPLPDELAALPEGGFGWFLIRDLSRDVSYRREAGVNTLSFRIRIKMPEGR
nr:ATP-binding protein [Pseudooceanicola algae]